MGKQTERRSNSMGAGDFGSGPKTTNPETTPVYRFGPYHLNPSERTLMRGNEVVKLPPKAFDTLVLMVRNSDHLMEKDELIRALWPDSFVEEGSLSNNIFLLRKALGEDPQYIETIPKRGYRFLGQVQRLDDEAREHGQEEEVITSRPVPAFAVKAPPLSQNRVVWGSGALALLIMLAAVGWYYRATRSSSRTIRSVAVLPFDNDSGDANAEYLSDGIAESLIDSLSRLPNLRVMSRDSAFRYRGQGTDAHTVGQALGVQTVVKGSVARQGDTLRISAELIDARDNSHLWGQQYSRKASDLSALQGEIATEMTATLRVRLTGEEQKRLRKTYTANPEAYESYLKGRYWWNKQTEEGFRKGIEYFEQAIAKDPSYALAYAGLADCYSSMANYGTVPAKEGFLKARESAEKALKLDDSLPAAHISLASIETDYEWDWDGAEQEARRAIELNPSDASARLALAEVLRTTGRMDEAIQERKRAVELDPLSIDCNIELAFDFFLSRRHDQAIEQGARTLELDPKYVPAYYLRGVAYVQKSMYKEAMAEFEKGIALLPDQPLALTGLGYGYAVTGRRSDAEKVLARLNERSKHEFVSPVWMAKIYSGLGEKDEAFESLERAYEDRSIVSVAYIKTNPMLDPLRTDPRFEELLRRLNLQP